MRIAFLAGLAVLALARTATAAPQPDPAPWNAVLAARARDGGFDYRGASGQDRKRLAAYLANLGDADPKAMPGGERQAFLVNAYNAMAVAIVLDRYPVKSILDVEGAFRGIRRRIGGEMLSLDDIENRLRDMKDARTHFAIVCASRSCPRLSPRAFTAAGLSAELEARAREFVADPSKNVFDPEHSRLALSRIFEWNRKEFERDGATLAKYVARWVVGQPLASWVGAFPREPEFLQYDWALNQP